MDKRIEVAYAKPGKQMVIPVKSAANSESTVQQVINDSGILVKFPEIDLANVKVGIFSQLCQLETVVKHGDRVEIYRSLQQSPMDARRKRVKNI